LCLVQSSIQKYFASRSPQIKSKTSAVLSHRGAARDRHERGTGCGGRECAFDEWRESGRRSRVVLTPRRWRSSLREIADDGDKQARSPGSTKEPVKTIARGMPGDSGVTVVTNARVYYITRGCGRIERPAFPAPSDWRGREFHGKTRAEHAAGSWICVRHGRHCEERSDEAIHSFFARRNGLLRFARNDGVGTVLAV
jgi:hypothetical protein